MRGGYPAKATTAVDGGVGGFDREHVARAGQDHGLAVGQFEGQQGGVARRDDRVVLPEQDQGRDLDRAQLALEGGRRVVQGQPDRGLGLVLGRGHGIGQAVVDQGLHEVGMSFSEARRAGDFDPVADQRDRVALAVQDHGHGLGRDRDVVWPAEVGRGQDQLADLVRVSEGELLGDEAAHRVAHHDRRGGVQGVDQSGGIGGQHGGACRGRPACRTGPRPDCRRRSRGSVPRGRGSCAATATGRNPVR